MANALVGCGGGADAGVTQANASSSPPGSTHSTSPSPAPNGSFCGDNDSGRISTPFPTLNHITVEWRDASPADSSSLVSVRYRVQGNGTWATAMPLKRIGSETSDQGRTWTPRHSGSVFDVLAGTTYEIELPRVQGNGISNTRCVTVTTRSVPIPMDGAPVHAATPTSLTTVLKSATAGDIVELGAGTYGSFTVSRGGVLGKPLVIRPQANALVNISGRIDIAADHVMLTGLTIQGTVKFNGARYFTFTRNVLQARTDGGYAGASEGNGIYSYTRNENAYIADNVIMGTVTQWNEAAVGAGGNNRGEGIVLTGPGHVIQNNHVAYFRNNISLLEDGSAVDQYSIDILNNDIAYAADDGIEADFCAHNCRIARNRLTNVFVAISSQPSLGGPTYMVRNVVYNAVHVAFKLYRSSFGDVLLHNTVVKSGDALGIYAGYTVGRLYSRNNLFVGGPGGTYGGYSNGTGRVLAVADLDIASADMDFDALGSTNGSFGARLGVSTYDSLVALKGSTLERNAVQVELNNTFAKAVALPGVPMSRYDAPDLQLSSAAVAANAGTVIPNINDGFAGAAPDAGAYELGAVLPKYGPR